MSINPSQFPGQTWDGTTPSRPDRLVNQAPTFEDWDQIVAELISAQGVILGQSIAISDLQSAGAPSVTRFFGETAGAVQPGHVLYNNAGVLTLADVASEAAATVYGISLDQVGAAGFVEVASEGGKVSLLDWTNITGTALLTPDAYYYVDASGGLTETPTAVNFEWVAQVGLALDENTLLIEIGTPNENTPE